MPDILFILLLAVIVLGPKRLPQVAAQVAKYLAQFQRMKREVLEQVNGEIVRLEKETKFSKEADERDPARLLVGAASGAQSAEGRIV
jgi:sec-independent protein translocase protein TatB